MFSSLRTDEMTKRYLDHKETEEFKRGCPLCLKPSIQEFKYWRIEKNSFPYDFIAKDHDMIVLKRHATEDDLTEEEMEEFRQLKRTVIQDYEYLIEPSFKGKSIPAHHHLHLINGRGEWG